MNIIEELENFLNKNNKEEDLYYKYINFLDLLNDENLVNNKYNKNISYKNDFKIKKILLLIKNKKINNHENLKESLKEIKYFRINKKTFKELCKSDKEELKKIEMLNNKNFKYYIITNYIYMNIIKKIKSEKVLKSIIYYYVAHNRKNIHNDFKKNIKIKRNRNYINNYLEEIKKVKKENLTLKNTYKYVKKIENELNRILRFKINISLKNKTVSIFDKKTNSFLLFDIVIKGKLENYAAGICNYGEERIYLSLSNNIKSDIVVFFHELGHMYDYFVNEIVRKNCKNTNCLREELSNIETENVSMFFEFFAEKILSKYTEEHNYESQKIIEQKIFKYFNNHIENKPIIKINNLIEEIYCYHYYIFREGYKYGNEEIKNGKDIYVYGYEKAINIYNSIS